jgi:hypothetical protein
MSEVIELAAAQQDAEERKGEAAILDMLGNRHYVAFQTLPGRTLRPRTRLFLVPKRGAWEWLGNSGLWRMRAKPDGSWIGLTYHSAAVIVEGSGLTDAALAIDRKRSKSPGCEAFFACADSAPWILCVMCRRQPPSPV